ncbi:MAG: hypothetical protein CMA35_00510 [Euryarchaeota archaeon]|nr:hypothetical protein [Euryarchaeota archaeon]
MAVERKHLLLAAGCTLVSFSFFDFLPAGPWLDASFSRGMSGLSGLILIYLFWYEQTFGESGVVPAVAKWKNPKTTWKHVMLAGLCFLFSSWFFGNTTAGDALPVPAPLILALIGLLTCFSGMYAYLVTQGPLSEEE